MLLSKLFLLTGRNELIAIMILIVIGLLGCIAFQKTMDLIYIPEKLQTWTLAVVCFAPYSIIYSVLLLREPIYFCFLTWSMYFFLKFCYDQHLKDFLLSILLIFPAVYMHLGHIGFIGVYILYFLMFYRLEGKNKTRLRFAKLVFCATVLIATVLVALHSDKMSQMDWSNGLVPFVMNVYQRYIALGGNTLYLADMYADNLGQFLVYTPVRVLFFLLSPLPKIGAGLKYSASFLLDSTIFLAGLLALIVYYVKYHSYNVKEHLAVNVSASLILVTSLIFCWATTTGGAALRHRHCLFAQVCLIIVIVWKHIRVQRNSLKGKD